MRWRSRNRTVPWHSLGVERLEDRTLLGFIAASGFEARGSLRVVGDFNNDGIPDLVAGGVLLGNGDGSFRAPLNLPAGLAPQDMVVGDFNRDGKLDLALTNRNDNTVDVLLGNGDGTFQAPRIFTAGAALGAIAVADFNGDGKLDLVVCHNNNSGGLSVLLGNGNGTFQSPRDFATGSFPRSVAVGDFDGDGNRDLVAVAGTGVDLLLGNGDGTFQAARSIPLGIMFRAHVTVGDLNGDHIDDLVVATSRFDDPGVISVLLGNGDGTFRTAPRLAGGRGTATVTIADVNGDAVPDLVVENDGPDNPTDGPSSVGIYLGNGDGTFQADFGTYDFSPTISGLAVADFDGDGAVDFAVTLSTNPGLAAVALGNGDGTFRSALSYRVGRFPDNPVVGDFNGDGIPDLIVLSNQGSLMDLYFGSGDGAVFRSGREFRTNFIQMLAVGDFNGDGIDDLAALEHGEVEILLGNGDGTFQSAGRFHAAGQNAALAVGDFNGDGIPDLAVADAAGNQVSVFLGNGDGTFQAPLSFPAGRAPQFVKVGDFDKDGQDDLVVGGPSGVGVLLGNGDGTFLPLRNITAGGVPVAVKDFDDDGVPDLVVANRNSVSVLLSNGDGTFRAPRNYAVTPGSVAVGDIDGDDTPDLIVVDGQTIRVLLGNGNGTFRLSPFRSLAGANPSGVVVADFNGDGALDLAVTNNGSTNFSVLLNDATGFRHPTTGQRPPRAARAGVLAVPLAFESAADKPSVAKTAIASTAPSTPASIVAIVDDFFTTRVDADCAGLSLQKNRSFQTCPKDRRPVLSDFFASSFGSFADRRSLSNFN